jgi:hypothetical protein
MKHLETKAFGRSAPAAFKSEKSSEVRIEIAVAPTIPLTGSFGRATTLEMVAG